MAGSVYALLVGINDYEGRVSRLEGCVEDIRAFKQFLDGHVPTERLHVLPLVDAEATRHRIIDGFTSFLTGARPDDVAIFYYSGHGSTEPVEERCWHLEPTRRNQTIVCFDSRKARVPDLADKEINELIRVVAAAGPHVLAVLDCCHAGGATRDVDVRIRSAPGLETPRPLDRYLPAVQEAWRAAAADEQAPAAAPSEPPRHVALSACESHQLSKELLIGDRYRGVFSAMLQKALTGLGLGATYRDLLGAASAGVRDRVGEQEPVGYAMPVEALDQTMFGGVVRMRGHTIALEHVRGQWWIDAGTLHGIQPPRGDDTTVLAALSPQDGGSVEAPAGNTTAGRRSRAGDREPLGQVRVTEVELSRSKVTPVGGWQPAPGTRYPTVVADVPIPPATVQLVGDAAGVDLVRAALPGLPHVREASGDPGIDADRFLVLARPPQLDPTGPVQLVVARPDGTPLTAPLPPNRQGAETIVRRLEHLARWHLIKRLANPGSSIENTVAIELVPAERGEVTPPPPGTRKPIQADSDGRIHLSYRQTAAGWQHPYVWIYLRNRSDRNLYCTLLDLTDRFRCHSRLFPGTLLPARATTVAYDGRPVDVSVPKERMGTPRAQVDDWFKLIAAEQRFAPEGFELPNLDGIVQTRGATRTDRPRTVLDRLADRVVTRDAGDEAVAAMEWTTAMITVRTHQPT